MKYQQNLAGRKIAIVVLVRTLESDEPHVAQIVQAVSAATPGSFAEVEIPFE